ncbi:globin domain-containing protein [Sphingomonas sp. PB4P5]|uniref:globin domain-containing protein n=1 Tax=Parasphingomonas puruogangriensis TaxID=3096155 RepID=UPI002FCC6086
MSPQQIELLRDSFMHVLFAPEEAATVFYDRLFALEPETRLLFRDDMVEQGRLLIGAIAKIITGLSRPIDMLPELHALAIRHVGYGVAEAHYAAVGSALLEMVAVQGGGRIDAATEAAWCEAYAFVAETMIEASRVVAPPPMARVQD